jgi:hypothetical protein
MKGGHIGSPARFEAKPEIRLSLKMRPGEPSRI